MYGFLCKIYKTNKKLYSYKAVVLCEGDSDSEGGGSNKPNISIGFIGSVTGGSIHSVTAASFKATINGGTKCGVEEWTDCGPWTNVGSCTVSDSSECQILYY